MEKYEIRIMKKGATAPLVFEAFQTSAYAAVRHAQRLADTGDMIEVWLNLTCVYASAGFAAV